MVILPRQSVPQLLFQRVYFCLRGGVFLRLQIVVIRLVQHPVDELYIFLLFVHVNTSFLFKFWVTHSYHYLFKF